MLEKDKYSLFGGHYYRSYQPHVLNDAYDELFEACFRGEIATRVISSARELDIETYAIYVSGDASHAARAAHVIELPSAASFMNIQALVDIVKKHKIDAVHPGYGFLSESGEFTKRMWEEVGAVVVGPGWGILGNTGDKLKARLLAEKCKLRMK